MARVAETEVPHKTDDFIFVEQNGKSFDELNQALLKTQTQLLKMQQRLAESERFQEKFFELFMAFTVLVTPIAIAFAFSHLTDDRLMSESGQKDCSSEDSSTDGGSSTLQAIRQTFVFFLIAISAFVGIPYYYYTLDDLCYWLKPKKTDDLQRNLTDSAAIEETEPPTTDNIETSKPSQEVASVD